MTAPVRESHHAVSMSDATFEQASTAYWSALEAHASIEFFTSASVDERRRVVNDMQRAYLALGTTEEGRLFVDSMTSDSRWRVAMQACMHALAWDSEPAKARLTAFIEQGNPYASIAGIYLEEYKRSDEFVRGLSWTPSS